MNIEQNKWSRRKFSKAVLSAQLLLTAGGITIPLSCIKGKSSTGPLNEEALEVLKLVMDELIPGNNKIPKASDIGVAYILNILDNLEDIAGLFRLALQTIQTNSKNDFKTSFQDLHKSERIAILEELETNESDLFSTLRNFTNESYYLNNKIHSLLGYELYPTGTLGPKMEPFDESLLARVKTISPFYTKI